MYLNLIGKHALVCGASEGIGRATAHELALLGADITLLARRPDVLQEVATTLPRQDAQQHGWLAADVAQPAESRPRHQTLPPGQALPTVAKNPGGPPVAPQDNDWLPDASSQPA